MTQRMRDRILRCVTAVATLVMGTVSAQSENSLVPQYDVRSYNQSGGITAGEVHFGDQRRHLGQGEKETLLKAIPKSSLVHFDAVVGGDSHSLAMEIMEFLESSGYKTTGLIGTVAGIRDRGVEVAVGPEHSRVFVKY